MTLKVCLADIAEIFAGQTFRDRAEADDDTSGIKLLQIRDIQEGIFKDITNLPYANVEPKKLKIRLLGGEILIPLRGNRIAAMLIEPNLTTEIITTTNQVAIILPKLGKVNPKFLLWYFNSKKGKQMINSLKAPSAIISHLSIKTLSEFSIDMPSLEIQKDIANIYDNWQQQKSVLNSILENGEILTERLCINLVQGNIT